MKLEVKTAILSRRAIAGLLLAWLALEVIVLLGLLQSRRWALSTLTRQEAQQGWQDWVAAEKERAEQPNLPARRKVPKSPEPPMLVLLRDHFPAVLIGSMTLTGVLAAFVLITLLGALKTLPPE